MCAAVISVINRKGGVGKTSTAVHLGGCFAERGQRVLLIDNDPQHSLTSGLMGLREAMLIPSEQTIAALFDETCQPDFEDMIHDTEIDGLSLVAGSDSLSLYNLPEANAAGPIQLVLKEFVEQMRDRYDFILIDNPPNLQLCSIASLVASDFALSVSQAEDFGSQGAIAVKEVIERIRPQNPSLHFLGFVLNMFDRRLSIHAAYEEMLRSEYREEVFAARLPLAVHFKEAISARLPVTIYKSRSVAAEAVRAVADELTDRVAVIRNAQRAAASCQMSKKDQLIRSLGSNIAESVMAPQRPATTNSAPEPSRFDGYRRTNDIGFLSIDKIIPDPDQPRKTFRQEAIEQMAESIRDHGVLQPILVRWGDDLEKWVIIAGESRFRASQIAELEEIPCKLVGEQINTSEVRIMQLAENCHRTKLPPVELAKSLFDLQSSTDWTIEQLARETRLKKPYIVKMLALLKLPDDVRQAVNDGELASSVAYELSQLSNSADQQRLADHIQNQNLARDDAVSLIKNTQSESQRIRPLSKRFILEDGTVSVKLNARSEHPEAEIRFLLESAIRQLLAQ